MASSSNCNGNLMDEFEEAFQACLESLTKQESNAGVSREEVELEVQQTASKFIDVARQMEVFFLQKRFIISTLKPDTMLDDENQELMKNEIARKDMLIKKHYDNLEDWKIMLSDLQTPHSYSKPVQLPPEMMPTQGNPSSISQNSQHMSIQNAIAHRQQQQQQQQIMQAQQAQQLHQMQQQQQQQQQLQVVPQQMHSMQQSVPFPNRPGPSFSQSSNLLPGPLAYLEQTTSNIDMAGMGDGRR